MLKKIKDLAQKYDSKEGKFTILFEGKPLVSGTIKDEQFTFDNLDSSVEKISGFAIETKELNPPEKTNNHQTVARSKPSAVNPDISPSKPIRKEAKKETSKPTNLVSNLGQNKQVIKKDKENQVNQVNQVNKLTVIFNDKELNLSPEESEELTKLIKDFLKANQPNKPVTNQPNSIKQKENSSSQNQSEQVSQTENSSSQNQSEQVFQKQNSSSKNQSEQVSQTKNSSSQNQSEQVFQKQNSNSQNQSEQPSNQGNVEYQPQTTQVSHFDSVKENTANNLKNSTESSPKMTGAIESKSSEVSPEKLKKTVDKINQLAQIQKKSFSRSFIMSMNRKNQDLPANFKNALTILKTAKSVVEKYGEQQGNTLVAEGKNYRIELKNPNSAHQALQVISKATNKTILSATNDNASFSFTKRIVIW